MPYVSIWTRCDKPWPSDNAILDDPDAKRGFDRLKSSGVDGAELLSRLKAIVLLERLPILKRGDWTEGSGKNRRSLKNFPKRLQKVAAEVRGFRGHELLDPRVLAHRPGDDAEYDSRVRVFECLPEILEGYAHELQGWVSLFGGHVAALARGRDFSQKLIVHLSDWVHATTGAYHDTELTWLISAAFEADGQKKDLGIYALTVLHSPGRRSINLPRITEVKLLPDHTAQLTIET